MFYKHVQVRLFLWKMDAEELRKVILDHEFRIRSLEEQLRHTTTRDIGKKSNAEKDKDKKDKDKKDDHKKDKKDKDKKDKDKKDKKDKDKKDKDKKHTLERGGPNPLANLIGGAVTKTQNSFMKLLEEPPEEVMEAPERSEFDILKDEVKYLQTKFELIQKAMNITVMPGNIICVNGKPLGDKTWITAFEDWFIALAQCAVKGERQAMQDIIKYLNEVLFYAGTLIEEWKLTHNMNIKNKLTQPPVPPTLPSFINQPISSNNFAQAPTTLYP
jgi:hypothetical protein